MAHRGVEWDWLIFFWQLWTDGDDRLDISEIKDIWPDNSSPDSEYNWTNTSGTSITSSAMSYLGGGSDEYQNFLDKGGDAGVDHGYGG